MDGGRKKKEIVMEITEGKERDGEGRMLDRKWWRKPTKERKWKSRRKDVREETKGVSKERGKGGCWKERKKGKK